MGMADALAIIPKTIRDTWGSSDTPQKPKKVDVVDQHADLVKLAKVTKGLDRNSTSWGFVAGWAAREILKARAAQDTCKDKYEAVALRARVKVLGELITVDDREKRKRVKTTDEPPHIP